MWLASAQFLEAAVKRPRQRPMKRFSLLLGRAAVVGILASAVLPSSANASPTLGDAKARAATLARQVSELARRAEVATEAYDKVDAELGDAVTRHLLAQRQLDALQAQAADDTADAGDRIRAIYQSGGGLALYASLFSASDLTDLTDRMVAVQSLVHGDAGRVRSADHRAAQAAALEATLSTLAARQTALEVSVAQATVRVQSMLAQQQQLLANADADVRRLEAAAEQGLQAVDGRAFAAALAAARNGQPEGQPSVQAQAALQAAQRLLGTPYVWGATGPASFDCSGLTGWAYNSAGISMPRTAAQQYFSGPHPPLSDLRPGDLLFWATDTSNPATIHHVAIYAGNGLMISTNHTGDVARLQPVWLSEFAGITRPDAATAAAVPGARWHPGA